MSEARNFLLLIVTIAAAPLIVGGIIWGTKQVMRKNPPAEAVNDGKELQAKWARGMSTNDGTVWQYQLCYVDGRAYSVQYVIGNSNHTKFDNDSSYPRGHVTIDGEKAKAYATEQQANNALLAKANKPSPPMPPSPPTPPAPKWPNTGTNPFGGPASAGGGFGSTDGKPSFTF